MQNWCKSSCHEVASELLATNATDPAPLDPKLMFLCISYYLGAFGLFSCLKKLEAERAKLVRMFVSRSRIGIFRDESTRSNPLDPKLTFWCVSYYLGAFGTLWLPYNTQSKTGQTGAKVRATKSRCILATNTPDPAHWTLNSCFGVFCIIWVHLGQFGCVTTLTVKRVKLVKNFVP